MGTERGPLDVSDALLVRASFKHARFLDVGFSGSRKERHLFHRIRARQDKSPRLIGRILRAKQLREHNAVGSFLQARKQNITTFGGTP